jgi:DNA polymerase III delta prime subunit
MFGNWMIFAVGVLPSDLLESIGVHSELANTVVNFVALLGALTGGTKILLKVFNGGRARLQARRGEGRRQLQRRVAFASFVEGRIRDLDNKEEWSDHRFAELEAEVEAQGVKRKNRFRLRRDRGLRRERSLSKALIHSSDQLVLLQGDPGSGKSVALRFVARKMASEARTAKRLGAVIPLYVNLKGLQRKGRHIDARLIEDHVLESLQHGSNRDVHRFLDEEFDVGKVEGAWLFLFDSFDEIPDVLSSSDADETVNAYSSAIASFLGMTKCRGIIASRYFRAPPSYGLPTFRIVPLSGKRRRELISKADLGGRETRLLETLPAADPELSALSENPLFLGLLVEYVRDRQELPQGWYDVFEAFVSQRTETDREKLSQLFSISVDDLRVRSEEIAFTMTATEGLGLNPRRSDLRSAYKAAGFTAIDQLNAAFDALEWSKLARSEEGKVSSTDPSFTFAHRRFQEYFATRVVLRDPQRISADTLLTNARWRETAVTLCQSQPLQSKTIVERAATLLSSAAATNSDSPTYEWQQGSLHILGLLQSAFAGSSDRLPKDLRENVLALLEMAGKKGTITDQKWALEVAGTAPPKAMADMLLLAFRGQSEWLRETAYRQAARLPAIPEDLGVEIRRALVALVATGQVHSEWPTTKAQVMRLRPMGPFLRAARLLRIAPWMDGAICLIGLVGAAAILTPSLSGSLLLIALALVLHLSYYQSIALLMTSAGSPLGNRLGNASAILESLIDLALLQVRVGSAILPLLLTITNGFGSSFVLSVLWLYAASWSLAATYLSIHRPPKRLVGWVLAPLYLIPLATASTKKFDHEFTWIMLRFSALGGGLFYLYTLLPTPAQFGIGAVVVLVTVGPMALQMVNEGMISFHDRRWLKRWPPHQRSELSPVEFLDLLFDLRGTKGRIAYIQRVRREKLLPFDREIDLLLRDILRGIRQRRRGGGDSREWYRSAVLGEWISANGNRIDDLRNAELEDQLGQLLEDLERDREIPVA